MGVNSLPKTVTRQRRDCDLNPGPTVPESSTLTTRLPSHPGALPEIKPEATAIGFEKNVKALKANLNATVTWNFFKHYTTKRDINKEH